MKVFLYLWYVCAGGCDTSNNDRNNLETQQKGIVIVDFPSGQDLYDSNENAELDQWATHRLKANDRILKVIPLRIAAIHINLPNPQIFKSLASVYSTTLNVWNARTKLHLGDPIEIRYKLQQYGKCWIIMVEKPYRSSSDRNRGQMGHDRNLGRES